MIITYTTCQPEHGIADDASTAQSKLAVESRAYPLFKFDPDAGVTFDQCCSLEGNPAMEDDWPVYPLKYVDEAGAEQTMELPMTFADFAVTEARFRKHFKQAPRGSWLHEFIDMEHGEREGNYPYIWATDSKNRLTRVMVSETLVRTTTDRRDFWRQLKSLVPIEKVVDMAQITEQVRGDVARQLTSNLLSMILKDESGAAASVELPTAAAAAPAESAAAAPGSGASGDFEPVWIDTPECDGCEECVKINPKIFEFNADKQAVVVDPRGGPFLDIVRAAEKCTVSCIHPGTPWNPDEKDLDKLVKRAEPSIAIS